MTQVEITSYKIPQRILDARAVMNEFYDFLDRHRNMIVCIKHGYITQLQELFEKECDHKQTYSWISQQLNKYRKMKNIPREYAPNKNYHSALKTAALEKLSKHAAAETSIPDRPSDDS